jgi:hypothetical protein
MLEQILWIELCIKIKYVLSSRTNEVYMVEKSVEVGI